MGRALHLHLTVYNIFHTILVKLQVLKAIFMFFVLLLQICGPDTKHLAYGCMSKGVVALPLGCHYSAGSQEGHGGAA